MKENINNMKSNIKFLSKIIFSFVLLLTISILLPKYSNKSLATEQETSPEFVYLSDIQYSSAKVGWGSIHLNGTDSGSEFSIKIEGGTYSFRKGIWAHASSEIVYNLTDYQDYDYFTTYMGVNTSSGNRGNGVKFYIYTSTDGKQWNLKTEDEPQVIMSSNDSIFVKIDITDAKFLKLVANDNRSNGNDHSVYVEPKLVKRTYKEPGEILVPSIEELNAKIKEFVASNADLATNKEYELTLLKRELISRAGDYALKRFLGESEENRLTYEWLIGDVDILRLYVMGGEPEGGNYYNSLAILTKLYTEYSSDFKNKELLNNPTYPAMTYGDLYKKMAMSIALTHTQRVGLWMQATSGPNESDALRRYAIFKYMHKSGGMVIASSMNMTHVFEDLQVEEMRFIMNNAVDDEEILWLNKYVQDNVDANPGNIWRYTTPHPYIAYVWPNYANPVYYNTDNISYFNELFAVKKTANNVGTELVNKETGEKTGKIGLFDSEFVIPGGKNIPEYRMKITRGTDDNKIYKLWMNFRNKFGTGCVCGGISKSGSNIRTTHGIPATVIGQPGHAALLFYSKDEQGRGFWRIDNDVSGWTLSEKGERMLLGWGNGNYARGSYQVVYMELAQAAINDYQNLIKAEELVMLAKVYNSDLADETKKQATLKKQETLYRKALEIQPINFDAWLGLIDVYNINEAKKENDFYDLAEELSEKLKHFPLPMYHATNLIKPRLTSIENSYRFTLLQTRILTEASTLPNNTADSFTVMQPGVTRLEANYLLGNLDKTIATFSFDGANAGKIVLSSRFDNTGVRWDYSLDGKQTWHEVSFSAEEEHKLQLTQGQINSITPENDIYVHIVGVNYDEKNLYKIDITEQVLPATLYPNDLENRVVGVTLGTEWRYKETDQWTSYSVASPDLTGDKTVQVRQSATGTKVTSLSSEMYTFTADNQPDTRKYIPVSHLNKVSVSTEAVNNAGAAVNALDANYNTRYHSAWNGTDTERYIVVKLDKPVNLSAVEFVPAGGGNGRIVKGEVLGSLTGEDDTWVSLVNNNDNPWSWPSQANDAVTAKNLTKSFEIPEENRHDKVQFIKIIATQTNGNWFAARAFNFYQDLTQDPHPTAGIAYSITEPTNGAVVARLVNPSTEITITSEGGDTHTFTENGEFTFEFEDKNGNKGTAIAKVTWIDKDDPTADIKYKLDDDKKLSILLDNISEDVYLLDENNNKINYIEVDANNKVTNITYLDNEGNSYKVLDKDEEGNTTKITYKNTTGNVSNVATYITTLEKGEVTSEEYFDAEGNKIELTDQAQIEALRVLQESTRSNPLEYALETSGEYEFKLLDKAENILYKSIKVDYINGDTKILASDITYNITKLTNTNVTATLNPYIIDTNGNKDVDVTTTSEGGNTHTFTENGEFIFKYKDASDDDNLELKEHKASVTWIDKDKPTAEITYSTTQTTNQAVIATLVNASEEIQITNNDGNTHTFTENGEFIFRFIDKAGNEGTATANVTWIDKSLPFATITYSETELTNQDVVATVTFDKENVTVAGGNTHTFTENGDYTFNYTTEQGATGIAVARVDWIDKVAPVATVTYSKTELTNQDVIAMLSFNENNVSIVGGNGHRFTENGHFKFEFTDLAGNKGTIEARVDWIDKTAPTAEITYSTQENTTEPVVATLANPSEEIEITNNDGNNTYTFTKNGDFTFEFIDKAGNKGTAKAQVTWINTEDKEYQELKAQSIKTIEDYKAKASEEELNNKKINAKEKENVIQAYNKLKEEDKKTFTEFINRILAGGKPVITKNSETLTYKKGTNIDLYSLIKITDNEDGNIVSNKNNVKITTNLNIEKAGIYDVKYVVCDQDKNESTLIIQIVIEEDLETLEVSSEKYLFKGNLLLYVLPNTTVADFKANITANSKIIVIDQKGNEQKEDDIVKTGMKMKLDNGNVEFTIGVLGDINGDGDIDILDLAKMKLHLIDKNILTGVNLLTADINKDGEVDINDLALMKFIIIGLNQLK